MFLGISQDALLPLQSNVLEPQKNTIYGKLHT